ncbi:MAG: hypothetical protein KGL39_18845 [Patescibacteria group bacterium]|nr:hypothetical protein [Patescibacteria group bacterium]
MTETKSTEAAKFFEWTDRLETVAKSRNKPFDWSNIAAVFDEKTQRELLEAMDRLVAEKIAGIDEKAKEQLAAIAEEKRIEDTTKKIYELLKASKVDDAIELIDGETSGTIVGVVCGHLIEVGEKNARSLSVRVITDVFTRLSKHLSILTTPLRLDYVDTSILCDWLRMKRVVQYLVVCHDFGVRLMYPNAFFDPALCSTIEKMGDCTLYAKIEKVLGRDIRLTPKGNDD